MDITIQDIKDMMESLRENKLSGLRIKHGDFELKIDGAKTEQFVAAATSVVQTATVSAAPVAEAEPAMKGNVVKSPIVGTFYEAPAPDKEPYVRVGSQVKKGDVLFIIESMKLMNEVTSDYSGIVAEIIAENGQGVEYGQPILRIE